jgi:hypothetical protein
VSASQAGDSTYAPATTLVKQITFAKETTGIRAIFAGVITANGTTVDLLVKSASQPSLNESLAGSTVLGVRSNTPNICLVETPTYIGTDASHTRFVVKSLWNGSCSLTYTFAGNSYWLPSATTVAYTVSGMTIPQPGANAAQTINFGQPADSGFSTTVLLAVSATSKLPVTVISTTPATCAVSTNSGGQYVVTSTDGLTGDTNTCSLQASQAGDISWAPAANVVRSFKWTRIAQTINFTLPGSRYYGGAATRLTATSTSSLPVAFTTTTPAICQVQTVDSASVLTFVTPLPVATSAYCYVVASQSGDSRYLPAPSLSRSIIWMKEQTTIQATWSGAPTVAGSTLDLKATSTAQPLLNEGLAGTTPLTVTSRTPNICVIDTPTYIGSSSVHTRVNVKALWNGNCQLAVAFAGNSYWLPVTATPAIGISALTAPQPGANAAQYLSVSTPATLEIGATVNTFPSSTSKLPVTMTSLTPAVCVATQNSTGYAISTAQGVTGNGNICQVQVTQAGTDAWAPAAPLTRTITVNKASMVARLLRTASYVTPTAPALLVAGTAYVSSAITPGLNSIGNFLTITTSTPTVCSITDAAPYATTAGTYTQTTVRSIANGTCTITWNFAETATQKAASFTQSLAVTGVK